MPIEQTSHIGARARMIRQRRGLSLKVAAELAGISKGYLSLLETGERPFDRRQLINQVANALGCSPRDLTDEAYGPTDHASADALATLPPLMLAVHDSSLDDVPADVPARPVNQLLAAVRQANIYRDQTDYVSAGRGLGDLLTELQIVAATGDEREQKAALAGITEWGITAYEISKNLGHPELALASANRGYEAATKLDDAALLAFARWYRALALNRLGADRRARNVLDEALNNLDPADATAGPATLSMEVYGLLQLTSALQAARAGNEQQAEAHLNEADAIAERTGECNSLRQHFGPTNTGVWRLSISADLGHGEAAAERAQRSRVDVKVLGSKNREAAWHFDLARALGQAGGPRDWDAIQHLDKADRIAPHRMRHDPLARELLGSLDRRGRRKTWELDSLRHRFGVS